MPVLRRDSMPWQTIRRFIGNPCSHHRTRISVLKHSKAYQTFYKKHNVSEETQCIGAKCWENLIKYPELFQRQKIMPSSKSRSSDAGNGRKRRHSDKSVSPKSDCERSRTSEDKKDSSSQRSLSPVIERKKRHKRTTRKRSLSCSPRKEEKEYHRDDDIGACRCLGVFGLSSYTEERDLKEVFSAFGDIEKLCLIYDKQARRETQGLVLDGRHIRVDYSLTLEPHPSTPGRYQGRRHPGYRSSSLRNRSDYYCNRTRQRDRSYYVEAHERKRYDRDEYDDIYDRSSRHYSVSTRRH